MQGEFLIKIRAAYDQLTKAEAKVAGFILQNPRDVLFMSITDLADACDVGDTSVFRFCRTMEFKGYQEFKMMLSLSLHEGDSQDRNQYTCNITPDDSFAEMAQKLLNTNVNALTEAYSLLKAETFMKAIDMIYDGERICFYGVGASMLTALTAANKFMRIEPKVYCVQDSHMQAMMASTMSERDVAVIFSYSGATKDTIHVADVAKRAGARIVCITRFIKSPLTSYADLVLLCGANEEPLQGGSTSAEISQLFLTDLLYSEYYRRYFDQCSKNNEKTSCSVLEKLC